MKKSPIEVFGNWATTGKDEGMEQNHCEAVENMLTFATKGLAAFSFIDAGCGNGWVVRKVQQLPECHSALGVDGAHEMIAKAKTIDPEGQYICTDLLEWKPAAKVTLVHSMEVVYYFKDPQLLIQHLHDHWLLPKGRLIIGLDFYEENTPSHDWPESCGIATMQLLSEADWIRFFERAGFQEIQTWRVAPEKDWAGTLVLTGIV